MVAPATAALAASTRSHAPGTPAAKSRAAPSSMAVAVLSRSMGVMGCTTEGRTRFRGGFRAVAPPALDAAARTEAAVAYGPWKAAVGTGDMPRGVRAW